MQIKKEGIRQNILESAEQLFAENGYGETAMAAIADQAEISVGNIYHYFKSKEDILKEILPEDLNKQLLGIIERKIIDWKQSGRESELNVLRSRELLEFLVQNRRRLIILFRLEKERLAEGISDGLTELFGAIIGGMDPVMTRLFYRKLVEMITEALLQFSNKETLSGVLKQIELYHLYGITHFAGPQGVQE